MAGEALRRELIQNADDSPHAFDEVLLNGSRFCVKRHRFWRYFVDGWEETTWQFYRDHVDPQRPVVDLGSFIGPTVLFAVTAGARRILAVEANPATIEHLQATRAANQDKLSELTIHNGVIHADRSIVSFGNRDGSLKVSSASSTRGSGFQVPAMTIQDVFVKYPVSNASVIKIDIEGSELDVREQISALAKMDAAILLSLHPPFWSTSLHQAASAMIAALRGFRAWTVDGKELDSSDIRTMIEYKGDSPPSWGTPKGNFFELVLKPRTRMSRIWRRITGAA